jgi:hypothetical protein
MAILESPSIIGARCNASDNPCALRRERIFLSLACRRGVAMPSRLDPRRPRRFVEACSRRPEIVDELADDARLI